MAIARTVLGESNEQKAAERRGQQNETKPDLPN